MHPNTSGGDRRSAFSVRQFRRGVLLVALTAALIAATGCERPTSPPTPTPDAITLPEPDLRDCEDLSVNDRKNSNCVTTLQFLLNTRGAHLPATGLFLENTLARVRQFQSARGLPDTGVVGDRTKEALYDYPPNGEEWDLRTECVDLRADAQGQCVRSLRHLLVQYGEQVPSTGEYGPETIEAVRHFQRNHDLPQSGVTDSITKQGLYEQLGSVTPPDWHAEVHDCPGPGCGSVYLDQNTVASIIEDFDTGTIVRETIVDVVLHFACALLFKATTLHFSCTKIGEWIIDIFMGKLRKAQADQSCIQISFETTPEGSKPSGLNQTERCPS